MIQMDHEGVTWGHGSPRRGCGPPLRLFSVHTRVDAHPQDGRDFGALVQYMMRSPVSLTRLRFKPGAREVVYTR